MGIEMNGRQRLKGYPDHRGIVFSDEVLVYHFYGLPLELVGRRPFGQLYKVLGIVRKIPVRRNGLLKIRNMFQETALDRAEGNEFRKGQIRMLVPVLDNTRDREVQGIVIDQLPANDLARRQGSEVQPGPAFREHY